MLLLDSGGVSLLAERTGFSARLMQALRREDLWPPAVTSVVLVECLTGHPGRDAKTNRFLKTCAIVEVVPEPLARRAAQLRTRSKKGSAVDALLVAMAETGGTVVTKDPVDLRALASHARRVSIRVP